MKKGMIRLLLLLLAVAAALVLICFGRELAASEPETTLPTETTFPPESGISVEELVGPWHLAEESDAIYDAFPGAMEFGSAMEIRSDGAIAWGIGADGAVGTYTMEGNVLHCKMMNVTDDSIMSMEFTVQKQDGQLFLITVYRDLELCWRWGEGETGKGE